MPPALRSDPSDERMMTRDLLLLPLAGVCALVLVAWLAVLL
jgi:hypothetical protein